MRQNHFRAQEADHSNQHPPLTRRETTGDTGDKTTSEPKKPTTPTNTHPPHEGRQPETTGDNGRQDHFRAQDGGHTNQHPPDKTTSEPKKPTTPTKTKAARSKAALRTPTVNCLVKKSRIVPGSSEVFGAHFSCGFFYACRCFHIAAVSPRMLNLDLVCLIQHMVYRILSKLSFPKIIHLR